jgi:hypothetical protein
MCVISICYPGLFIVSDGLALAAKYQAPVFFFVVSCFSIYTFACVRA